MSEVKVNKISPRSGTDVTLGDSGDTITVPTGVTLDTSNSTVTLPDGAVTNAKISDGTIELAKLSATGTKDATTFLRGDNTFASAGGTNTPAFEAYLSADQAISSATFTKIQINTEILDSDGNYDNATNYRFTPTTAGKYYVYGNVTAVSSVNNTVDNMQLAIYKNGSIYKVQELTIGNQETRRETMSTSAIIDFNGSSDYVELFAYCDVDSGTPTIEVYQKGTNFGAFKIIE